MFDDNLDMNGNDGNFKFYISPINFMELSKRFESLDGIKKKIASVHHHIISLSNRRDITVYFLKQNRQIYWILERSEH